MYKIAHPIWLESVAVAERHQKQEQLCQA